MHAQFTLDFLVLERWLIATEVDMRTFVQNERVSIIIRITTCREKQTNNYYIIKMHKTAAATSTYLSTRHTHLYTVSECLRNSSNIYD